jgi:hypothetical protein
LRRLLFFAVRWHSFTLRERAPPLAVAAAGRHTAPSVAGYWAGDVAGKRGASGDCEASNAGDLDVLVELSAEDIEFTSVVAEIEGTTFRGG